MDVQRFWRFFFDVLCIDHIPDLENIVSCIGR